MQVLMDLKRCIISIDMQVLMDLKRCGLSIDMQLLIDMMSLFSRHRFRSSFRGGDTVVARRFSCILRGLSP